MGEPSEFQVGQTVELQDGRTAIVRFVGSAHFAGGDWVGVELDDATGKNDGAVQGERYFDCESGHGMFVRPGVTKVIDQPTPKPSGRIEGRTNGTTTKGRPSSIVPGGLRRQSFMDSAARKRQSINAGSPTPGAKAGPSSRILGVCCRL